MRQAIEKGNGVVIGLTKTKNFFSLKKKSLKGNLPSIKLISKYSLKRKQFK